jgi:hypothetical protein
MSCRGLNFGTKPNYCTVRPKSANGRTRTRMELSHSRHFYYMGAERILARAKTKALHFQQVRTCSINSIISVSLKKNPVSSEATRVSTNHESWLVDPFIFGASVTSLKVNVKSSRLGQFIHCRSILHAAITRRQWRPGGISM